MNEIEWEKAAEARKDIFRPRWFGQLMNGNLSLGDTFWIGNFGVALVFAPVAFAVLTLMMVLGAQDQTRFLSTAAMTAALAIYWALLTRAVFLAALRTPQVGGWRWIGVSYTTVQFIALTGIALIMIL